MSSVSSGTTVYTGAPRVAHMFLAKFDHKEGYKMVWESSSAKLDSQGLEYKSLPSGVHEFEATSIYLTHESRGKLFYGSARFRQVNSNAEGGSDRSLVKMYSLGILTEPLKGKYWTPLEFSNVGWEHFQSLDAALQSYLNSDDLAPLKRLYSSLSGNESSLEVPRPNSASSADHPLTKLPLSLSTIGPLVFPIFKAAVLRKSILIFNHSSQASPDLISEPCFRSPAACAALAYIISLISVIPKNASTSLQANERGDNTENSFYSRPLYTIGLQDINTNFLSHYPGYLACTSDEIIKYQKQVYDYAVVLPTTEHETCKLLASTNINEPIKATHNDYGKFMKLYKTLPQNKDPIQPSSGDDRSSIGTSSSVLSAIGLGYLNSGKNNKLRTEPNWWYENATSPMSWREYVWSAFAWFASAGLTDREASKYTLDTEETPEQADTATSDLVQLTKMVGNFHSLTKKWFHLIEEIISEVADPGQTEKITLELTPQDIVDMELDPYSSQDLEFVRELVLTYWGSVVAEVEIGIGFHSFLC